MAHQHSSKHPLQVASTELGPCHHRLAVKVPAARVQEEFDHALAAAARGLRVPGFRPGKVPAPVLRKLLGENAHSEAREHLFEHIVPEAIHAAGLNPLRLVDFDPSGIEIAEEADLAFEVEVECAPQVELPPWEEIEVAAEPTEATPEQIEQAILGLGREHPRFDDSAAAGLDEGTLAECDLQFLRDGEEGPRAAGLKLGLQAPLYGADPDEFERAMRGARSGDQREVPVTFNDGFERKDWIGAQGLARIEVKRLVVPRPATAEELAATMGLEGVEELRREAAGQIGSQNEASERQRRVQAALDAILQRHPFALPVRLVDEETEAALQAEITRMKENGVDAEEAAKQVGTMRDHLRSDAESRLRHYFLVRRIAAAERVRITPGDMETAYRQIGSRHGADPKMVRSFYEEKGLDRQLGNEMLEGKVRAQVARILDRQRAAAAPVESGGGAE